MVQAHNRALYISKKKKKEWERYLQTDTERFLAKLQKSIEVCYLLWKKKRSEKIHMCVAFFNQKGNRKDKQEN